MGFFFGGGGGGRGLCDLIAERSPSRSERKRGGGGAGGCEVELGGCEVELLSLLEVSASGFLAIFGDFRVVSSGLNIRGILKKIILCSWGSRGFDSQNQIKFCVLAKLMDCKSLGFSIYKFLSEIA